MLLKLIRENVHEKLSYTRGSLFYWNQSKKKYIFLMYTLEHKVRDLNQDGKFGEGEQKIYGKTAVPYGEYIIILRYSPSKKRFVPELVDVNSFKYAQFHSGNDLEDSIGCILVGYNRKKDTLWNSYEAERDLVVMLEQSEGQSKIKIV